MPISAVPPPTKSRRFSLPRPERLRSSLATPRKPPRHPTPTPYPIASSDPPVVFPSSQPEPNASTWSRPRGVARASATEATASARWRMDREARTVARSGRTVRLVRMYGRAPRRAGRLRLSSARPGMGSGEGTRHCAGWVAPRRHPHPNSRLQRGMDAQLDGSPIHESIIFLSPAHKRRSLSISLSANLYPARVQTCCTMCIVTARCKKLHIPTQKIQGSCQVSDLT